MAESTASNRISLRFSAAVARGLRESGAIVLVGVALVLLVALLSFNPHDPGFSFTGEGGRVHNRIGPVGAWFADALYFLFGRPAYLLPAILGIASWHVMRPPRPIGTGIASESCGSSGRLPDGAGGQLCTGGTALESGRSAAGRGRGGGQRRGRRAGRRSAAARRHAAAAGGVAGRRRGGFRRVLVRGHGSRRRMDLAGRSPGCASGSSPRAR